MSSVGDRGRPDNDHSHIQVIGLREVRKEENLSHAPSWLILSPSSNPRSPHSNPDIDAHHDADRHADGVIVAVDVRLAVPEIPGAEPGANAIQCVGSPNRSAVATARWPTASCRRFLQSRAWLAMHSELA